MSTKSSDFDQSIWEIVGVSAYEPKRLPEWLRDKLDGWYCPPELTADDEVVKHQFAHLGIGQWRSVFINDEEAFIWETGGCDWFADHFHFAETMDCGLILVEPSPKFQVGTTGVLFPSRYQRRRRDN